MNNDISNDVTKYYKTQSLNQSLNKEDINCAENINASFGNEIANKSMECLNNIGLAKVNMDNFNVNKGVEDSIKAFRKNPELITAQVDFCDGLIQQGYSYKDAIFKTDAIFSILKDGKTYH